MSIRPKQNKTNKQTNKNTNKGTKSQRVWSREPLFIQRLGRLLLFVFSWLTLGIAPLVWSHRISNRIGNELRRRGINYSFGAGTFWGWGVLGILILIGPFVDAHKLLRSMNLLAADYNVYG